MTHETNLRVGVKASADEIYLALTNPERLAAWWTSDTRGDGTQRGNVLEFWFGTFCQKFEVTALEPGKLVRWKATKEGMEEWAGTEITFALEAGSTQTFVHFAHTGWRAKTSFFGHCAMKWGTFLMSLKDLLEKGAGRPAPNDLAIDHGWAA